VLFWQVVEGAEMESESHEEAGDEEIESGAAGNESDMDLDLLAESDSDSEESQVQHTNFQKIPHFGPLFQTASCQGWTLPILFQRLKKVYQSGRRRNGVFQIEHEKTTNLTDQKRLILIEHDLIVSFFEVDLVTGMFQKPNHS